MKTRASLGGMMGLVLAGVVAVGEPAKAELLVPIPNSPELASETVEKSPPSVELLLPPNIDFSPWLVEVIKLGQGGLEDNVLLSYVSAASGTFNLGADHIIYLRDLGFSRDVIVAMMQHDQELTTNVRQAPASTVPEVDPAFQTALNAIRRLRPESPGAVAAPGVMPGAEGSPVGPTAGGAAAGGQVISGIVHSSPAAETDFWLAELEAREAMEYGEATKVQVSALSRFPVREPHAVRLTSPIVIVNVHAPAANLSVFQAVQ